MAVTAKLSGVPSPDIVKLLLYRPGFLTRPLLELTAPAIEVRGLTKAYPGVVALDHVDIEVRPGSCHAL